MRPLRLQPLRLQPLRCVLQAGPSSGKSRDVDSPAGWQMTHCALLTPSGSCRRASRCCRWCPMPSRAPPRHALAQAPSPTRRRGRWAAGSSLCSSCCCQTSALWDCLQAKRGCFSERVRPRVLTNPVVNTPAIQDRSLSELFWLRLHQCALDLWRCLLTPHPPSLPFFAGHEPVGAVWPRVHHAALNLRRRRSH